LHAHFTIGSAAATFSSLPFSSLPFSSPFPPPHFLHIYNFYFYIFIFLIFHYFGGDAFAARAGFARSVCAFFGFGGVFGSTCSPEQCTLWFRKYRKKGVLFPKPPLRVKLARMQKKFTKSKIALQFWCGLVPRGYQRRHKTRRLSAKAHKAHKMCALYTLLRRKSDAKFTKYEFCAKPLTQKSTLLTFAQNFLHKSAFFAL